MYTCLNCGKTFSEPRRYVERHALDTPPYETYTGCPECGEAYAEAIKCDECDKWICGEYIKTASGQRICENCYNTYDIGDED